MRRLSHTASSLTGMFKEVYAEKINGLTPGPVFFDEAVDIDKATYSLWEGNYSGVVHPLTYAALQKAVNKLKETPTMGTLNECAAVEETPLQRELNHRKYQVRELRANIARKQEELRIALALLAAVKKLDKGGK